MIRLARGALAIGLAVITAVVGYAISDTTHSAQAGTPTVLGPGLVTVTIGVHYSRFSTSTVHVRAGTIVRFLIRNDDPINHEFIVGDARVHAAHERGRGATHPPVLGEVSVGPGELGETFYRFDASGRYLFACHLPGHFAYGMQGYVVVDAAT
jgi:uncharacterized cupredoxin-like copper-binding protein